MMRSEVTFVMAALLAGGCVADDDELALPLHGDGVANRLDRGLAAALAKHGFTGRIAETLEARLGRPLDPALAEVGRLLFFDEIASLNGDNTCCSCHTPAAAMGDTQSIAIGIDNNRIVGP